MRTRLLTSICALALATGCVTQGKYDTAMQRAQTLEEQLKEEKGARTAADEKVRQLEEQVKGLEEKVAGVERDKEALGTRLTTAEARLTVDDWRDGNEDGSITEVFACGTAAVITPVGA